MNSIQTLQCSTSTMTVGAIPDLNQSINVSKVRNIHTDLEKSRHSQFRRTLDSYGIDDNRNTLSHLNREKYNVFVKKDKSGTADLSHGAYISKKGEDIYGSFKWLNPKGLTKYQTEKVAVVTFRNQAELTQLSRTYSEKPLPDFLIQILNGEECRDTVLYSKKPQLAKFIPPVNQAQHGYLIRPNSPYSSDALLETYIDSPEKLKDSKEGIILCTYAIHPGIQSDFLGGQHNQPDLERLEVNLPTPQKAIDEKTKMDSLTSILSLKLAHLPQLEKLREGTLQHLQDVYHTNENDNIRMFFHFPVAEKTATLHLHTWVNKGDHPLNEPRSFDLDTIIEHLQQGKDINELVLNRNEGSFFLPTSDSIKDIVGIPFKGVVHNSLTLPL
ncbi:hypothetical protein FM037_21850 [Shewanella psychropiezotolerans]|uniref:Scavenger mRNA decapping enzyme C-term binding n=2 Tax=Shewanella TaxID=22 RepID=A0A1S6HQ21_9GAMM|nr:MULTISPECIES: hypothetical protein [Shewanella]AQS37627.1 Scavenger mRNA decapping enzyme C-term binding [Shewanella psychrophila]QDO85408.1 hypothetical protein FM037_21850 [Shewanella psychropiezotolerans]